MVNKLPYEYESSIDIAIFKFLETHMHIYKKLNFTPNILTTFSLIFGLFSAYLITKDWYKLAALMYFISYYYDCADGKFARKYKMVSVIGDYYDHISDVLKGALILYALNTTNKERFSKWIIVIVILLILSIYHLGLQQCVYNEVRGTKESPTLDIFRPHNNKKHMIHHTRVFGMGTFTVLFCLIIFFWKKNNKSV